MISSPSPTQQPPQKKDALKEARSTPGRKRVGETPTAMAVKRGLRPLFRGVYFGIQGMRTHKLMTLCIILITLVSIIGTTYVVTRQLPFGIGRDPWGNTQLRGSVGDHVLNWLHALRDGDATKMNLIQAELIQDPKPDVSGLIDAFSQSKAHLVWKDIVPNGSFTQNDTTVDSYITVYFEGPGPNGSVKAMVLFHFTTLPQAQGRILFIHTIMVRPPIN